MSMLREPATTNSPATSSPGKTLDEQVGLGRSASLFSAGRRRGARVRARSISRRLHGPWFTGRDDEAAARLPAPLLAWLDDQDGTAQAAGSVVPGGAGGSGGSGQPDGSDDTQP